MPGVQSKSPLAAKFGARMKQAAAANIGKKAVAPTGGGQPPPGINRGKAQLIEWVIDAVEAGKTNAGMPYFRAAATIVAPKEVQHEVTGLVVPCEGLRTGQFQMMCETKTQAGKVTSFQDNFDAGINMMKLVVGEEAVDAVLGAPTPEAIEAGLVSLGKAAIEAGVVIEFSTRARKESIDPRTKKPYPPGVWETWHGTTEHAEGNGEAIEDGTTAAANVDEAAGGEAAVGTDDLAALVAKAMSQDADAGTAERAILARAKAANVEAEAGAAADWETAAGVILAAEEAAAGGGEPEADAEPEPEPDAEESPAEWKPEVAKVYKAKLGAAKKATDFEVLKVFEKTKVVYLKDLTTGKPLLNKEKKQMAVAWDKLEH